MNDRFQNISYMRQRGRTSTPPLTYIGNFRHAARHHQIDISKTIILHKPQPLALHWQASIKSIQSQSIIGLQHITNFKYFKDLQFDLI
jgi:hypothetical protein